MPDASLGGKVGIDYGGAKNQVGAFHQPRLVLASPSFLSTLPDRELASGLAAGIEWAIIGDPDLFRLMETQAGPIWKRDAPVLEELIPNVAWREVDPWLRRDKRGRPEGTTYVLTGGNRRC